MSNIRLSCVMVALAKLDQCFNEFVPDTHYDRARALYHASIGSIEEDCPYFDWVNQIRSELPFNSLDLVEEQTAYRWYLDLIQLENDLPFSV